MNIDVREVANALARRIGQLELDLAVKDVAIAQLQAQLDERDAGDQEG